MKVISTETAPAAIGPYSQAIVTNGLVFASGQIPVDPATGAPAGDTIDTQAEQLQERCRHSRRCRKRHDQSRQDHLLPRGYG